MSEWISVDDMVPAKGRIVIVYDRASKCVFSATYDQKSQCFEHTDSRRSIYDAGITHWMFPPQPPK
jgi:hypothetical protein